MQDRLILVTGAAGQIGLSLCEYLADDNEVWGLDLFTDSDAEAQLQRSGVTTRSIDLATGAFGDLPTSFDYVLHLAAFISGGDDYDSAFRVNAEGTGLLLSHCRAAKAVLVMSTSGAYFPHSDPFHAFVETDPLGGPKSPYAPTYGISKIAEESVARTTARMFKLPTVIARMSTSFGVNGGIAASHLDSIVGGLAINLQGDGMASNPIYQGDINCQVEQILGLANVPATIVNWGGDEVVTERQWCEYLGVLAERRPKIVGASGVSKGGAMDISLRMSATGPCPTPWQEGMRLMYEQRYPSGPNGPRRPGVRGAHALEAYQRKQKSDQL
jgi:nucleoside-diphosphate-sugar epimerase